MPVADGPRLELPARGPLDQAGRGGGGVPADAPGGHPLRASPRGSVPRHPAPAADPVGGKAQDARG
eukprot:8213070-Pyramimonas_sp.AAC.1